MRIEITLSWVADAVEVRRLDDVERFTIGSRATDDLFVPLGVSEGDSHTLLARAPDGRMWLWPLDEAPRPLDERSDEIVAIGAFTVRVRAARPERGCAVAPVYDLGFANISTLTCAAMAAFVALLAMTPAPALAAAEPTPRAPIVSWARAMAQTLPRPSVVDAAPRTQDDGARSSRRAARRAADGRLALAAASSVITSMFEGLGGAGRGAGDATLRAALDGIGARRESGLGLAPGALRGPSTATAQIGLIRGQERLGHVDSRGGDRGGCGPWGCRAERAVELSSSPPMLVCDHAGEPTGCDVGRDLIRRVVKEHHAQLRFCFEKALQRAPGLAGRAVLSWTITASGQVSAVTVAESDLPASLGACLTERVKTWRFPAMPAWGTGVAVHYPFVFRQG